MANPGQWTPYSLIGANTTNATVLKAAGGKVGLITAFNLAATPVYLKLYDKASTPAETDTPVQRYMIPGNAAGAGFVIPMPVEGIAFFSGITFRLVTGIADNDTGAPTASQQLVNIGYI